MVANLLAPACFGHESPLSELAARVQRHLLVRGVLGVATTLRRAEMTWICPNCGSENWYSKEYCPCCGTPREESNDRTE